MPEGTCSIGDCDNPVVNIRGWCNRHYKRWLIHGDPLHPIQRSGAKPTDARVRFWSKVDRDPASECWLWAAAVFQKTGYGQFDAGLAHRWAYEHLVGPIPDGLQLDHLCRVRHCVNPAHLEPVTPAENLSRGFGISAVNARKTHCKRGHEFTPSNTYRRPDGGRACRACQRDWVRLHGSPNNP